MFLDFFFCAVIQLSLRGPVDDEPHRVRMEVHLCHELGNAACSLNAPTGAVADQEYLLQVGQNTAADVFHTGFVVYHNIGVLALKFLYLSLNKPVYKAVAALALGTAHNKQVKVLGFG